MSILSQKTQDADNKSLQILIVDDEPSLRDVLGKQLKSEGHLVHIKHSGNSALQFLLQQSVDLVISDMKMADGDGIFLLAKVRELMPNTPVLLMSGYTDIPTYEAFHQGAVAVLKKPFNLDELLESVQKHTLSKEERWKDTPPQGEHKKLVAHFAKGLSSEIKSRNIAVGYGGFSLKTQENYQEGEKINFAIAFAQGDIRHLQGSGNILWCRPVSDVEFICGIEIECLDDQYRAIWLDFISLNSCRIYLPNLNSLKVLK